MTIVSEKGLKVGCKMRNGLSRAGRNRERTAVIITREAKN